MPQFRSFNKNIKLYPVVATPGNPLLEFEEGFYFNRKKEWAQNLGNPSSAFFVLLPTQSSENR